MFKPLFRQAASGILLCATALILLFASCRSFPRGYRLYNRQEIKKAEVIFHKRKDHRTYAIGARFYPIDIHLGTYDTMPEWIDVHNRLCCLWKCLDQQSFRVKRKLMKRGVTVQRIQATQNKLEDLILEIMCARGTIADVDSLYSAFPCWVNTGGRDTIRDIIVNRTLNPGQPVYGNACKHWIPPVRQAIDPNGKGSPCSNPPVPDIRYNDATAILTRYSQYVIRENYPALWEVREHIWDIFQTENSFCDMARFKADHPKDLYARDCWFDTARDTLCMSLLRPLLAFHRNNPHTALDFDICYQIVCLSEIAADKNNLTAAELTQLEDVRRMVEWRYALICRKLSVPLASMPEKIAALAKKYPGHWVVFDLAKELADYCYTTGDMKTARLTATLLKPLYPDAKSCATTDYDFQIDKQRWFTDYETLLERAGDSLKFASPIQELNTEANDEFSLVSWGEGDEVFFVRKDHLTGGAQVMRSEKEQFKKGNIVGYRWSKPVKISELSVADDVEIFSMSNDGHLMLLHSGGQLLQSFRYNLKRPWSRPDPLPINFSFTGRVVFSPDAQMLLFENFASQPGALQQPKTDLFVSKIGPNGRYNTPQPLGNKINSEPDNDGRPLLVNGGRMLIFTSDRNKGLGETDLYRVKIDTPNDWTTASAALNMGLQLNTIRNDDGLTFFSEYTGQLFFHRRDECTHDLDIWTLPFIQDTIFPPAIRLAGIVLDENHQPITGGFMEFTTDYNLHVQSQLVSEKGTYAFTAQDNSQVIRLFPEIPGYYSERDTTHFLATVKKGEIVHDTFILTSFDYIRHNFKLHYSTFKNGTNEFDNPLKAFPELTRLAKIATRMGAELDLAGHTDSIGSEKVNYPLSLNRANSVKAFLVEKCGFPNDKIHVQAFGATCPVGSNSTVEGRQLNRRIEVKFRMPALPEVKKEDTKPDK